MPLYTVLNQFQEGSSHIAAVVRRRKKKGDTSLPHHGGKGGAGADTGLAPALAPAVLTGGALRVSTLTSPSFPAGEGGHLSGSSRAPLSRPTSFTAPSTLPPGSVPQAYQSVDDSGIVFTLAGPKTRRAREKLAALGLGQGQGAGAGGEQGGASLGHPA